MADNLARIRQTMGSAPAPVKLIVASKYASPKLIETVFRFGVTEFGENRIQDALSKRNQIDAQLERKINWHFIGHLQSNKVKQAVGNFSLIQSIDSVALCGEVSRTAESKGLIQPVLLQVKMLRDDSKYGFEPDDLKANIDSLSKLAGVRLSGLMTMTPLSSDPEVWRTCFMGLKQLRDELEQMSGLKLAELSMGTSQDWQEAIKYGATMIRLGRAIFGAAEDLQHLEK